MLLNIGTQLLVLAKTAQLTSTITPQLQLVNAALLDLSLTLLPLNVYVLQVLSAHL